MARRIVTVVREDGEVDYVVEETLKYAPPPYQTEAVDREVCRCTG